MFTCEEMKQNMHQPTQSNSASLLSFGSVQYTIVLLKQFKSEGCHDTLTITQEITQAGETFFLITYVAYLSEKTVRNVVFSVSFGVLDPLGPLNAFSCLSYPAY